MINQIKNSINDMYWWVRWRIFDKYHVVKTGLKQGYYDIDELMLFSAFTLLERFVEIEDGLNVWDDSERHKVIEKEIRFLYSWWQGRKVYDGNDIFNYIPLINEDYDDSCCAISDYREVKYQRDTEMLFKNPRRNNNNAPIDRSQIQTING